MRVLLLIDSISKSGGAEQSPADSLPILSALGLDLTIRCLRTFKEGIHAEAHRFADVRLIKGRSRLERVRSMRHVIREVKPTLVHSTLMESNILARAACFGTPFPLLNSLVSTPYDTARFTDPMTNTYKHRRLQIIDAISGHLAVDHFHAITHAVKEAAIRALGYPCSKITVVERGRSEAKFRIHHEARRDLLREMGFEPETFLVFNAARQCFPKGQIHLLRAVQQAAACRPNVRLLIAGREGDASKQLKEYVAQNGLSDTIRLLGPRDDIPRLLSAADVFVFPSLIEGLGGAMIEAMATGLPIIASDIPVLREVLGVKNTAALVPPGNSELLCAALINLHDDASLRVDLGADNRERFLKRFQLDRNVERLAELYEWVAGRGRPRFRRGALW